ncbi:CBL-interacting serine/threonine-protein kinase 16 [Trifolium repens]|nr:CBL-interacting serine/threonine-protein kinase 16 [Trifolium repens]
MEELKANMLFDKYEVGRILGKGTFAKVYYAKDIATGEGVAIKVIDKDKVRKEGMMEQIKREISVMRLVKHPNIVNLKEVMATKTKILFVMEYARGGELFDKVAKGKFKEELARKYFQQLISAVDYCHSRGVSHRDLKPENMLLDENGDLKVSDFGLSALPEQLRQDGLLHTQCGTPAYVAPEVVRKRGYSGFKADTWSCGVILYALLAGFLPFQHENLMSMYNKVFKEEYQFPPWFSPESKRLISKILVADPERRITIPSIMNVPWFRKGFDLSGLFEEKKKRGSIFTSKCSVSEIVTKIESVAKNLKFKVKKAKDFKLKLQGSFEGRKGKLAMSAEIYEVAPELAVVEFSKSSGDTFEYVKLFEEDVRPALKDIVWSWQGE